MDSPVIIRLGVTMLLIQSLLMLNIEGYSYIEDGQVVCILWKHHGKSI